MVLYYNPDCSKCNEALDLLRENNCQVEIRNYLADPPSVKELRKLTSLLDCKVTDIIRTKEHLYQEKFLDKEMSENEWYEALSNYPLLIERPILISGHKAVVGRPPVRVLTITKG